MRNIYVLPTDKPSKKGDVVIWNGLKIWDGVGEPPHHNQNIYITSDEEIKEGDWCLDSSETIVVKCLRTGSDSYWNKNCKKIILTTDQDLIKDGVQSIPDEFLEWFVKNPSCESVEIVELKCTGQCWKFINSDYEETCLSGCEKLDYKIIIPKEELKQDALNHFLSTSSVIVKDTQKWDFSKQETVEEYIKEVTKKFEDEMSIKFTSGGIKLGIEWQAERSYSEFEAKSMLIKLRHDILIKGDVDLEKWFEQFKKKL